jgi:hypothetical protein
MGAWLQDELAGRRIRMRRKSAVINGLRYEFAAGGDSRRLSDRCYGQNGRPLRGVVHRVGRGERHAARVLRGKWLRLWRLSANLRCRTPLWRDSPSLIPRETSFGVLEQIR